MLLLQAFFFPSLLTPLFVAMNTKVFTGVLDEERLEAEKNK